MCKIQLLIICILAGTSLQAQEYAKYSTKRAKDTVFAQPEKDPVVKEKAMVQQPVKETEKEPVVSRPSGNFQELMNKAGEQAIEHNYKEALKFYGQALDVSTKDVAWRVFVSRASAYTQMKDYKKAIREYTIMIEDSNTPEKKRAYAHLMRATTAAESRTKKDDALICDDLKKAGEFGLGDTVIKTQQAYALNCR